MTSTLENIVARAIVGELCNDKASAQSSDIYAKLIGRYCVIRCTAAGVHVGTVRAIDRQTVVLDEARRLWAWRVPMGKPAFLSGVAIHGIDHEHSKVGCEIQQGHVLADMCEVIPTSAEAEKLLRAAPDSVRER